MLESARQSFHLPNVTFVLADAQSIPFGDSSFEAVIANNMLYHVPNRRLALSEIHRVLVKKGSV
jgi:ubiquinone/menaquinone biosynthesis C-methylase UbiE